ncbi:MAG: MopE-related protein [Planctomycetota bacterium]|jgi:hypothetical protein
MNRALPFVSLAALSIAACLPALEDECSNDTDCSGSQVCRSGGCFPEDSADTGSATDGGGDGTDSAIGDAGLDLDASGDAGASGGDATPPTPDAASPEGDAAAPGPDAGRCPLPPGVVVDETCNGVDDDCDGAVDESGDGPLIRVCYDGPVGTAGIGQCRRGLQLCLEGAWGACREQVLPAEDACNGADDDCDGRADENPEGGPQVQVCYDGPAGTAGVGDCTIGVQACEAGGFGACVGERQPADEVCDEADNDCDGEADEGLDCGCEAGAVRPCYNGPAGTEGVGLCRAGEQRCGEALTWGPCDGEVRPDAEVCNGRDDDCNGEDDDGLGRVGEACTVGVGACGRPGELICDAQQGRVRCGGAPGEPGVETCSGEDDDCDGRTDEGFGVGDACEVGVGACVAGGVLACSDGAAACNAVPDDPEREICDGRDNDCDGRADEGVGRIDCYDGDPDTVGVGVCRGGTKTCDDGQLSACEDQRLPAEEICDGEDNDCDGRTDEVGSCACSPGSTRACYSGQPGTVRVGECIAGQQTCAADGSGYGPCEGEVIPAPEICNGRDDDCDGRMNEDLPIVGDPCGDGFGECWREGEFVCDERQALVVCTAQAGEPAQEICNGLDDDCDGTVDERWQIGALCSAGDGTCEREGRIQCDSDGVGACNATPGMPTGDDADCNLRDDDCDGDLDEAANLGGTCTLRVGTCEFSGIWACADDGVRFCLAEIVVAGESCNLEDDDCDGNIDEGGDALCPAFPGVVSECVQGACELVCPEGFSDEDGDPFNGCERGCGPPIAGGFLHTFFEGRPDVPAIAYADNSSIVAWSDLSGNIYKIHISAPGQNRVFNYPQDGNINGAVWPVAGRLGGRWGVVGFRSRYSALGSNLSMHVVGAPLAGIDDIYAVINGRVLGNPIFVEAPWSDGVALIIAHGQNSIGQNSLLGTFWGPGVATPFSPLGAETDWAPTDAPIGGAAAARPAGFVHEDTVVVFGHVANVAGAVGLRAIRVGFDQEQQALVVLGSDTIGFNEAPVGVLTAAFDGDDALVAAQDAQGRRMVVPFDLEAFEFGPVRYHDGQISGIHPSLAWGEHGPVLVTTTNGSGVFAELLRDDGSRVDARQRVATAVTARRMSIATDSNGSIVGAWQERNANNVWELRSGPINCR